MENDKLMLSLMREVTCMAPTIFEHSIQSKSGDPSRCEDGLFLGSHYLAVVDGVTGKGSLLWPPSHPVMTSGCFAKTVLLSALAGMPGHMDAPSAIAFLNDTLRAASLPRLSYLTDHPEERLQAVIILYSCQRQEIWAFGDCACIIDGARHTHAKAIDTLMSELRSRYNQLELLLGTDTEELLSHDTGRDAILPLLRRQSRLANADGPLGYDVLDGFSIHPERTVIYPVSSGAHVILASDGYPELLETLSDSEAALARLIEKDPLCIGEYPGTKGLVKGNLSFDDRTYLRFQV